MKDRSTDRGVVRMGQMIEVSAVDSAGLSAPTSKKAKAADEEIDFDEL